MKTLARGLAALVLLPLGGCPLFSVQAEIPEVCMTFRDRLVEGVPAGAEYHKSFSFDSSEMFGPYLDLDAEITKARITLQVQRGPLDLAFLDTVSVSAHGATGGALQLVDCRNFECASESMTATVEEDPPAGLMDLARQGRVAMDISMTGPLPTADWVVDVEVCLSGKASASISL